MLSFRFSWGRILSPYCHNLTIILFRNLPHRLPEMPKPHCLFITNNSSGISGLISIGSLYIFTGFNLNRNGKTSSPIWGGAVNNGVVSSKSSFTLNSPRTTEGKTSLTWVSDLAYMRIVSPTFTRYEGIYSVSELPRYYASSRLPRSPGYRKRSRLSWYQIHRTTM